MRNHLLKFSSVMSLLNCLFVDSSIHFLLPMVTPEGTSFAEMGHHIKTIIPVSIPTVPQLRPVLEAISRGSSPIPPEQVLFCLVVVICQIVRV